MNDQRIIRRPPFRLEYCTHTLVEIRARTKAIDGLRRKGDEFPRAKKRGCYVNIRGNNGF